MTVIRQPNGLQIESDSAADAVQASIGLGRAARIPTRQPAALEVEYEEGYITKSGQVMVRSLPAPGQQGEEFLPIQEYERRRTQRILSRF